MGLGQTIIATAFLVLLTVAVVTANRMMMDKTESYYEQEAFKQASYYANSLLDEISRKRFDANANYTGPYQMVFAFCSSSSSSTWGPSPTAKDSVNPSGNPDTYPYKSIRGDNNNYFDDVDDYHGYIREVNTGFLKGFKLKVRVCYVRLSSGVYIESSSQQYLKKAEVKVWNTKYLSDTLMFNTIVPY